MGLRKGAILQPARPGRAFKGLGDAKRYCRKDLIGDNFAQDPKIGSRFIGWL